MDLSLWNSLKEERGILQKKWELEELLDDLKRNDVSTLIEIGTHQGGSARAFLEVVDSVIAIDVVKQPEIDSLLRECPGRFEFILGHSVNDTERIIRDIKAMLPGFRIPWIDCVFVDGDHTPVGSMRDFEIYSPLVRPGGLVVFHDIVESDSFKTHNIRAYETFRTLSQRYKSKAIIEDNNPLIGEMGIGIIYL